MQWAMLKLGQWNSFACKISPSKRKKTLISNLRLSCGYIQLSSVGDIIRNWNPNITLCLILATLVMVPSSIRLVPIFFFSQ